MRREEREKLFENGNYAKVFHSTRRHIATLVSRWIIHENAFKRARRRSRKRLGSRAKDITVGPVVLTALQSILAKNVLSFKFRAPRTPWVIRQIPRVSALMATSSKGGPRPHLSPYMSINDSSPWHDIFFLGKKIKKTQFPTWNISAVKHEVKSPHKVKKIYPRQLFSFNFLKLSLHN